MMYIEPDIRYQGAPSKQELQRRYDAVSEAMKKEGMDFLLMQTGDRMLSGYVKYFLDVVPNHFANILFSADQEISFFSHGLGPNGALPAWQDIVGLKNNCGVPVFHNAVTGDDFISREVIRVLREAGCKKLGLVGENLISMVLYRNLVRELPDMEIVNASEMVDRIIVIKSPEQIGAMYRSVANLEAIASIIGENIHVGMMERELCVKMRLEAIRQGCDDYLGNLAVTSHRLKPGIVSMHHQNKRIEEGDLVQCYIEANSYEGYFTELVRLWSIGPADSEVVECFAASVESQDYLASLCTDGAPIKDVFRLHNEWLTSRGYAPERRMFGHGQGYSLNERPNLAGYETMCFQKNMTISIQPQITTERVSVCCDDNYIVTDRGAVRMSTFPRKIFEL